MRFTSLLTAFLLTLTLNGIAQQSSDSTSVGTLTLQQCIDIAQEQSSEAIGARYSLIASKWSYKSYHADLLPSLELSGDIPNYSKTISSNRLDNGETVFSPETQSEASTTLSLNQNILYTGGQISLTSGLNKLGIFEGEDTYIWRSSPLEAVFRQPLFQFNNLKWRHKIEPLQYKIAKKEYVQSMEGIAEDVAQGFFNVYLDKINLENAQFNVTQNDSIYQISQGRYKVGSIAENELLHSELELRQAQSTLSNARIEYRRALNNFKITLGYPTSVQLSLKEPNKPPKIKISLEKAKQLAMKNNSESLNYRLDELQAKRDLASAEKNANFSADITARYGLNQTAPEFQNVYENPQNSQFFTVGFDIPLFNWGKQRAQIKSAENQQRSTANDIKVQRRRFFQEVDYTVSQFAQLRQQVLLAAEADTIATRQYQVSENRYKIGKIDITDLFNAQDSKDQSRQGYIRSLSDFWTGLYNLRQLTHYNFREDHPIMYEDLYPEDEL